MEQPDLVAPKDTEALFRYLELRFGSLNRRLDVLDRHAGDLMFLAASSQDILLDKRRAFSERSQALLRAVVAAQPYEEHYPSCEEAMVLTRTGGSLPGAEYDHFFRRGLNRAEHGWLICRTRHADLTYEKTRTSGPMHVKHTVAFRQFVRRKTAYFVCLLSSCASRTAPRMSLSVISAWVTGWQVCRGSIHQRVRRDSITAATLLSPCAPGAGLIEQALESA